MAGVGYREGIKWKWYYTWEHLADLLTIRRLTAQGLGLDAVRRQLRSGAEPPAQAHELGALRLTTHVELAPGVELVVDTGRSGLGAEPLRRLAREVALWLVHERKQGENNDNP